MTAPPAPLQLRLRRSDAEIVSRFRSLNSHGDVAELLEIPDSYLKRILYRRREPLRYRSFTIKKRAGGERLISAPPSSLAILQAKLNHVFQLVYKRKRSVHGFVSGKSILTNASQHAGRRWVLNVDLQDFFPSINFGRVRGALMARPYQVPAPAATVVAQICCAANMLPQGAPTSPMLANIVCGRLDGELFAMAKRLHCVYTRYGDDLTFSARAYDFPSELAQTTAGWTGENVVLGQALTSVIEANGFRINSKKTRLQLRDCRQEVTGITVNKFPNVPRRLVREVRAMLHAWERYGLQAAEDRFRTRYDNRDRRPGVIVSFRRVVKGKLDYIKMIRGPDDPVYCRLRGQMNRLDPSLVGPAPASLPRPQAALRGFGANPGWTRWYRQLGASVFLLEITLPSGERKAATAFAIRRGHTATAAHTLRGVVAITTPTGPVVVREAIVRDGRVPDCALLVFDHGANVLHGDHRILDPGEHVAVLGFASVPQRRPALGIYAGTVESISDDYAGTITYIHISVASAGGLSGSPVIDSNGRVIGIVVESAFEDTQDGVPRREFCTVLPIRYVSALEGEGRREALPVP